MSRVFRVHPHRTLLLCLALSTAACAGASVRETATSPDSDATLGAAAPAADTSPVDRRVAQTDCHTEYAADDVAGFVEEWFGVVAGLQLSVDVHPIRQFLWDPRGDHLDDLWAVEQCGAAAIAPFQQSRDPAIRNLATSLSGILAAAMQREKENAALFRATDWRSFGSLEAQARHWSEIRIPTHDLSERTAMLNEAIAGVLREDGRPVLGPGRLRITRRERETAMRHRFRFADLSLLVEYRVDGAEPLSLSARNVLKWLLHDKGLTYADSPESSS